MPPTAVAGASMGNRMKKQRAKKKKQAEMLRLSLENDREPNEKPNDQDGADAAAVAAIKHRLRMATIGGPENEQEKERISKLAKKYLAAKPPEKKHGTLVTKYVNLSRWALHLTQGDRFNLFIIAVIIFAGLLVGMQQYPYFDQHPVVGAIDNFVLVIFTLEVLLKLLSEGLQPWRYFTGGERRWNNFDFFVVVLCMPFWGATFGNGSAAILRLVRLTRVMRLVKKVPQLQMIVMGLIGGMKSIGYIMALLFLVFYLYAVLGVFIFRENDPFHFGDLFVTLNTLFRLSTLEDWTDVTYINYYGCDSDMYFNDIYTQDEDEALPIGLMWCPKGQGTASGWIAIAYFVTFVVISALVMLSLFVGAVTMSMTESMENMRQEKEETEKKRRLLKAKKRAEEQLKRDEQEGASGSFVGDDDENLTEGGEEEEEYSIYHTKRQDNWALDNTQESTGTLPIIADTTAADDAEAESAAAADAEAESAAAAQSESATAANAGADVSAAAAADANVSASTKDVGVLETSDTMKTCRVSSIETKVEPDQDETKEVPKAPDDEPVARKSFRQSNAWTGIDGAGRQASSTSLTRSASNTADKKSDDTTIHSASFKNKKILPHLNSAPLIVDEAGAPVAQMSPLPLKEPLSSSRRRSTGLSALMAMANPTQLGKALSGALHGRHTITPQSSRHDSARESDFELPASTRFAHRASQIFRATMTIEQQVQESNDDRQRVKRNVAKAWAGVNLLDLIDDAEEEQLHNHPFKIRWVRVARYCMAITETNHFVNFITFVIICAGVLVGAQTFNELNVGVWGNILSKIDTVILSTFTIEVCLKTVGEEFRPWLYFWDPREGLKGWNTFDYVVVAGSFLPGSGSMLTMLRLLRLLRVLKLVKSLPELQIIVVALIGGISSISYIGVILFMVFYVFAILGMFLFQENDPWHFGSLHISLFTLFRCSTLEDWTDVMYINMYGCNMYGYRNMENICTSPRPTGIIAGFYFLVFIIIGALVLMTLFIGVVTTSMEEATAAQQEQLEIFQRVKEVQEAHGLEDKLVRQYERVFKALDLDGSNTIDGEELRIGLQTIGQAPTQKQLGYMLKAVDADDSGEIDVAEFVLFMCILKNEERRQFGSIVDENRDESGNHPREIPPGLGSKLKYGMNKSRRYLFTGAPTSNKVTPDDNTDDSF